MSENNNCYLIDWFSASCLLDDFFDIFDILGFNLDVVSSFSDGYGHHGYAKSMHFEGIFVYFDYYTGEPRVWVEMSGTGCRTFETYTNGKTFLDLFRLSVGDEPFFSLLRVDFAYDIYDDVFLYDRLRSARDSGCIISSFDQSKIEEVVKVVGGEAVPQYLGRTMYFGSQSSDVRFRLYDKKLERNRDDISSSWYRFELQFRRSSSLDFVANYVRAVDSGCTIGEIFAAFVGDRISVRERNYADSNYRRWAVADWWQRFVNTSCSIQHIEQKDKSYNVTNAMYLASNMYGNTFDVLLQTIGVDQTLELVRNRAQQLNLKQIEAIRDYNNRFGDNK